MAMTLAEASKLARNAMLAGVIETIIRDSPMLQRLPFIEVVGNGLTYNQESNLSGVAFYDVNDTWQESTPTFNQVTAVLRILGGDADVDNFLRTTRVNVQDMEAAVIAVKAKALQQHFEHCLIYGSNSANPKEFDGLRRLVRTDVAGSQVIACGASGGPLTLAHLDQLIDVIRGGKPDILLMSRRSRRSINALIRASGTILQTVRDEWGRFTELWDGIPIGVSDYILDTHTVAGSVETGITGGNNSVIFALRFGEGGLCGLTAPGYLTIERIGPLETKDATRTRLKWYCSLALFNSVAAGALIGVQA